MFFTVLCIMDQYICSVCEVCQSSVSTNVTFNISGIDQGMTSIFDSISVDSAGVGVGTMNFNGGRFRVQSGNGIYMNIIRVES